jgi:hypothetical protein
LVPNVDPTAEGVLEAMMLNLKGTFDETVETHAAPEQARTTGLLLRQSARAWPRTETATG